MKHIARQLLCLLLAVCLCAGMICVTTAASTEELPPVGSLARKVVDSCEYTLDLGSWSTVASEGGAGHLQGICTDDDGNYLYASFTNMLVKVDMHTGRIAGTVTGLAAGSISSGAHIGDICYYDGKIYGSLEYKASERWYICVFDGDKITEMDMPYTTPGVMYGLYVPQVGDDFRNELTAGEHSNSAASMGHRYGTGGIDGITFGTLPGRGYDTNGDGTVDQSTGDKRYMIVTYGPYGNAQRYDNENFVFLVYNPDNITSNNLLPFTENLLKQDYTENQKLFYEHKLFCYAGNQTYGVQQLEYDEETGDLWLECYNRPSGSEFPGTSRYVIDGSVPLYMDTVEVGQSVTGDAAGFVSQAEAKATAACYTDYEDADSDGDKTEQETGWHMTLKCLCGSGKTLQNDHTAQTYGKTGKACKICGKGSQFSTGLRSLGNDYFYGATSGSKVVNGKTYQWGTASLYRLNRDTYTFEKLTEPARLLMSYTMDAADTYEKDGKVYLKDASGNGHDALVEGTYAAIGQGGKENTALGFCGDQYGSVLDRVAVTAEGMKYINDAVEDTYSYSFWLKNDVEMDRFTPIIGMYRDETLQKGLYDAVFEWRYRTAPAVISHVNTGSPVYETFADGKSYITKPGTGGGDGSTYVLGYSPAPEKAGIGKWTHWVVVKSGSNVVTYQNGVQVDSANRANNTKDDILSAFEIGGYINRNWIDSNVRTRLTGLVDDVRIYAGGLTQSEVTKLYNGGAAESAETGTGAVAASSKRTFGSYTGETLAEQEDPIVYLKMDETGTVKDYSGNDIHAETSAYVSAAANKENQAGRSLYFDGRSHVKQTKLSLSKDNTAWLSAQLNATKKLTISFWMNAAFENSHRMSILGIYDKQGRPMGTFETRGILGQDRRMDGKFAIAFTAAKPYSDSGVIDEKTYEQLAITDTATYTIGTDGSYKHYGDKQIGQWYHVVGELDGTANTLSLYLDGQLVQQVSIASDTLGEIGYFQVGQPAGRWYQYENAANTGENQTSANGRQGWAMRDGFVGTIDEIKIFNRILSADEVSALYSTSVEGHTLTHVEAKDATCAAEGNIDYWTCSDEGCGKWFSDAEGKTVIEDHDSVKTAIDATKHGQNLSKINAVEATCTADGVLEYWTCSACNKNFSNAEGTKEITDLDAWKTSDGKISSTGHKWSTEWSKDKTHHWHACSGCDEKNDVKPHTPGSAATENDPQTCTVCGYIIAPATGHIHHTTTLVPAVEATCVDEGHRAYYTCSGCSKLFADENATKELTEADVTPKTDPTNHVGGTEVLNAKDATYTEEGYTGDTYCLGCGNKIAGGHAIPKLTPAPAPVLPVIPSKPAQLPFNPNAGSSVSKFPFTDVPSDSWYYSSVKAAWENGLIDGVTANEFKPNATLTVAQTIKLAAALHQLDRTGEVSLKNGGTNWYDSYVNYAVTNGIIEKDYANYTKAQMNAPVTRGEFVHIFHGAEEAYKAINTVADNAIPDVKATDKFAPEIYEFYRAGILTGSDAKGTFHSASTIKRSEAAAILFRMFEASARKGITLN